VEISVKLNLFKGQQLVFVEFLIPKSLIEILSHWLVLAHQSFNEFVILTTTTLKIF